MSMLLAPALALLLLPAPQVDHGASSGVVAQVTPLRDSAARLAPTPFPRDRWVQQATAARRRNWFQRHPAMTGAIVGFVTGFAIGWAAGDDGVFDDFTGEFNGCLLGSIGSGAGALIGWSVGRS
jgi:hypothetical protein